VEEYSNSDINNFGLSKQQNLITANVVNYAQSTFLDTKSLKQHLDYSYSKHLTDLQDFNWYKN